MTIMENLQNENINKIHQEIATDLYECVKNTDEYETYDPSKGNYKLGECKKVKYEQKLEDHYLIYKLNYKLVDYFGNLMWKLESLDNKFIIEKF